MLGTGQEGTSCLEFEETLSPPHHGVKLAGHLKASMHTLQASQSGNAEPLAAETGAGNMFMTSSLRAISVLAIICLGLDFHRTQQQVLYRQHRTKCLAESQR